MPRQIPKVGDVFRVTLSDGRHTYGQVLSTTPALMNSATMAFFDSAYNSTLPALENLALGRAHVVTLQHVTRDLFNGGYWSRVGNREPELDAALHPIRGVGARIIGSRIIADFLDAYHGLRSWTEMHDPNYYTKLL